MAFTGSSLPKKADGDVSPFRFTTVSTTRGSMKQAAGGTTPIIGSSPDTFTKSGDVVESFIEKVPPIEYGGNVTAGAPLTANADGKAIVASAGDYIGGYAIHAGVAGDIGEYLHAPGKI